MRRVALLAAVLLAGPAFADDECRGHSCNNTGGGDTSMVVGPTDVAVSNTSKSFAFAHGLGDVDINDCLASTQWGTILVSRQTVVLNQWCAGEVYDAKGLPVMAAIMRCNIPEIRGEFGDEQECRAANTVQATVVPAAAYRSQEFLEEKEEEHEYQLAQVMQRQAELEDRLKNEAANRRRAQANYAREQRAQAQVEASETEAFLQQYKEIAQLPEPTGNE